MLCCINFSTLFKTGLILFFNLQAELLMMYAPLIASVLLSLVAVSKSQDVDCLTMRAQARASEILTACGSLSQIADVSNNLAT